MPSLAELIGPFGENEIDSGLVSRCLAAWDKPISELTNQELATVLRQKIGVRYVLPIAQQRVSKNVNDDTEIYDGELAEAIRSAASSKFDLEDL